jgi:hypothetical protein
MEGCAQAPWCHADWDATFTPRRAYSDPEAQSTCDPLKKDDPICA